MILITGATGHLGTATITHLLKKTPATDIAALARDEAKAAPMREKGVDVRIGSFDDKNSLAQAMQGIEKVLLISGTDHNRLQQHKNVVDAAKAAGVKHIAYTGVPMKDMNSSAIKFLMESHFQTEDYIKASGIAYTFLRNTLYADGIPFFAGEGVFENGIYLPAGDGKVPYALRREMAEAAGNVLLGGDEHENKTYDLTGPALYSFEEVAQTLSRLSGKSVTYNDADATDFKAKLGHTGLPQELVTLIAGFSADIKKHQLEIFSTDMEQLIGRKPASLTESLKEIYKL